MYSVHTEIDIIILGIASLIAAASLIFLQIDTIRARCALLLSQMKRIRGLLEIDETSEHNPQWKRYRTAIASCLGNIFIVLV